MKFVTLITEPKDYSQRALKIYRSLGPVYFLPALKTENKKKENKKTTNILVVGLNYQIDKKWIDEMPNLKIIASPATGYNHLDVFYARKKGIKIISLRGRVGFLKNISSTAEETTALMLALVRNIPWSFQDVLENYKWDRIKWRGHQLLHKTLGLYGFGRLGKIMARYGRAFGMRVIACDPYVSKNTMIKKGVKKTDVNTLFKESDILSLHVLLTDKTYNLVKKKHLKMMKPTAYLINTARGELIEKGVLEKALKNKWIAGAAIDVLWDERSNGSHLKNNPLVKYAKKNQNLIIVPHIGGATFEAMEVTQNFIAELIQKEVRKSFKNF